MQIVHKKSPKIAKEFHCKDCDYYTSKISDYNKHLSTTKHKNNDNSYKNSDKVADLSPKVATFFVCECGRNYKYRQGLYYHRKSCNFLYEEVKDDKAAIETDSEIKILTNLVLNVIKQNSELSLQNQELTNKIVDICKTGQSSMSNSIANSNIHSNNKTFNLQFFLNETCKDAMNITEFVDSLQLQLSDLEEVGKLGYVEGISNIIVKNLKKMDVHKRPVHCADKKREVVYIKDEDKWEKDDEQNKKLRKVINRIAYKNERLLPKFKELHPGCNYSESKYSDHYSKLVIEAMGGAGNNNIEKEDKIIRNITKAITIDKSVESIECIN
jgi:hypothetical protein